MVSKSDMAGIDSFSELIYHLYLSEQIYGPRQFPVRDWWRGLNDGTRLDFDRPPREQGTVKVSKGKFCVTVSRFDVASLAAAVEQVRKLHREEPWWVRLNWWLASHSRP